MYAIVETGGKQYRAEQGAVLEVEKLDGAVGAVVTLDRVLLMSGDKGVQIGTPTLDKAKCIGEVSCEERQPKRRVKKKKRRKNFRRTNRDRQLVTKWKITGIVQAEA